MPITDPDQIGEDTGLPRWVKVSGIVVIALAALVVIVALVTGGHGPGRHALAYVTAAGGAPGWTP
jgi:hypothetical protein